MYRQSEKNFVNINTSSTCSDNMVKFGLLTGWDLLASYGHPCRFQRVSRLGSVTARHSSSGRQPNFAALKRGRHLHSAGRPSRWALTHISSSFIYYRSRKRSTHVLLKFKEHVLCFLLSCVFVVKICNTKCDAFFIAIFSQLYSLQYCVAFAIAILCFNWLCLHVGNPTYNSIHSTSRSPIPVISLKLN